MCQRMAQGGKGETMTREEAVNRFKGIRESFSISIAQSKFYPSKAELNELCDMAIEALSANAVQTDLVQRSDVLEVISEAQDGSGSTYNILQPIFVKVNNLPSCHRCDECDEQFYQQILEKGMIELPQEYVSVVRCKDCRYFDKHETWSACTYWSGDPYEQAAVEDKDYCSRGERREP